MEGFDFGSPLIAEALTGKLAVLPRYNGLFVPAAYFEAAMERLQECLDIALEDVTLPALSPEVAATTEVEQTTADEQPPVEKEQLTAQEWFERGYLFDEAGNTEEAIRCYNESIRITPNIAAYVNLGVLLVDTQRPEQAEIVFRTAIQLDPNLAQTYDNLGVLLAETQRPEQAEEAYRTAIQLDPNYANAYYNMACLKSLNGEIETAFEWLREAFDRGYDNKAYAWEDADLAPLREDPRFEEIVGPKPE